MSDTPKSQNVDMYDIEGNATAGAPKDLEPPKDTAPEPKKQVQVEPEPKKEALEPELSPTEQEAINQGWRPKEQWVEDGNDPDDWRSAKEFVERGELFKQLHAVRRQLKEQKDVTDTLKAHHQKVYESAYQNAVRQLRQERREALQNEEFDKADEIEERLDELKEQRSEDLRKKEVQSRPAGPTVEFQAWVKDNSWYQTDPELKEHADAIGIVYSARNPGAAPSDVFNHVSRKVRESFPAKFGGVTTAPNPVSSVRRSGPARKAADPAFALTDDEEKAMNMLVKHGHMTQADYIAEIKKVRG